MSSFFLYFNDGNPDLSIKPEAIGPQLVHFPWVQWKSFQSKHLQIIYTKNKTDVLNIFPDRNNKLLFIIHGHILESEGGITRIDKGQSEYSIENQMRKRYELGGINSCIGLNGQYNFLVWDAEKSRLEIANDRLGMSQLFFTRIDGHRFVLTTDIVTLKSVPRYSPKVSRRGIFDLLYMGVAFEDRTVLEGVIRLLPNASYQIFKNNLELIEEKRLPFSKKHWGTVLPPLLDELEQKYVQGINRAFTDTDKIIFLQSGGKDSRLFSHFFKKACITPQCKTSGETHHNEVFLAREVSHILGFPWERVGLMDDNNLQYQYEILKLDSFSVRTLPFLWLNSLIKYSQDHDYITGAFLGDVVIGDDYVATKIKIGRNNKERTENFLNAWGRPSYCTDDELRKLFINDGDDLIQQYKNDMEELLPRLADDPYDQLRSMGFRANHRFKMGCIFRTLDAAIPFRLPCIDNDLMDFCFSIPPALCNGRSLMNLFLIQRSQNLSAVPLDQNSGRGTSLYRGLKQELKYKCWCNYIERVKFPLLRLSGYHSTLTKQCYVHIFSLKEKAIQEMLKDSIISAPKLENYLDIEAARKLLNKPLPTDFSHIMPGNTLRSLVTVTQIAKTFNS